ncbi:HEPN-associated N-terminal domain-containing protein [Zunongwangia sp. HGR-M22]|uniref:HEPN-associated N-terminal domain-containing protein n=1 Tax=Zunongwangia sp. HGR-M22 TaxID=3015168 RepID=UPI0022DE27D7|nr:HEPN-associated N-terminal domain-containing protein [Zunongwangia sp. HGR-M22]WBL24254.1 HEPN-associated N-terminal domain-containing protein [Zunongwangia sp. HGR-M22]
MGGAKHRMMELEEQNLMSIPDKNVCVKHINDNAIKTFIKKNYKPGYCDYCEKDLKVVSLEELLEFMMRGISNFFEDAGNYMSYNGREGGYLGQIYTPDELIQERIGLETEPFRLTEDIVNSIEDIAWSEPDQYYDTERDELMYQWSYFKTLIKHKSRYLFQQNNTSKDSKDAYKILKEVGRLSTKLNLIKKIDKGTFIYRCRQHEKTKEIKEKARLVAPPEKNAIYPNRFSPSGISMLYSAFDPTTAILETISREDPKKTHITISKFEITKDIYVIDYSRLPKLPSIFAHNKTRNFYLIKFLNDLVKDFTKDIKKDGKEHIEYVPTQVVTEFLRYPFNKKRKNLIEGLIYPSSKKPGDSSSVIFWNNEDCLENLELLNIKIDKVSNYAQHRFIANNGYSRKSVI